MYKSLQEFIDCLEREGELLRIDARVSTDCEIAEITDRISQAGDGGKALLFADTAEGVPVVTNIFGSERRMAMALGVGSLDDIGRRIEALLQQVTAPKNSLSDKLRMLPLLADMSRWMPKCVSGRGACQQIVETGDDVNLERLPVLKCRELDGGRFVTLPMVHTLDPDTGMRNVGMYRMQILDRRTTGMHWHIHKTGARHYDAFKRRGERMPVSVTVGGDPVYTYCATAPMPDNMDEYLLAGFLRRKPVRLVKCLTNDIYVPEDCDFVIEGYVDTSEPKCTEGPFGDHTGFFSLKDSYPRFHVTAVTRRRRAVWPATVVGIPPQEDAYIALATEKIFLAPIRMALQPEIVDLTMPVAGTAHNIAVVSIAKRYDGQAVKTAQSLWGAGQMMFNKYMVLTDASVDVRSTDALAALVRGADVHRNIIRSEGVLDILDHATATCGYGGKLALDLTGVEAVGEMCRPAVPEPSCGITGVPDFFGEITERWGAALLFAAEDADVERFVATYDFGTCRFAVLFDPRAEGLDAAELLWLAAANSDPRRDVTLHGDVVVVDARSKRPGREGNPARFPNVVVSSAETVAEVDRRWTEYGLGAFVASPSERYRRLLLSESEEWHSVNEKTDGDV